MWSLSTTSLTFWSRVRRIYSPSAVYLSDCAPDISVELYKEAIEKLTAKRDELKNSEDKDDETAKTPDSPSADGAPVSPEEENK